MSEALRSGARPSIQLSRFRALLEHARDRFERTEDPVDHAATARPPEETRDEVLAEVVAKIEAVAELPALPDIIQKLDDVLAQPAAGANDLAAVLNLDPGIAMTMLRLVNSSVFGLRREIRTLDQAVVFLGVAEVRSLALTATALKLFPSAGSTTFEPLLFWSHSLTTAIAARKLTEQVRDADGRLPSPEEAFLAGLLHDVGKIALAHCDGEMQEAVYAHAQENRCSTFDAERAVLGATHADIGALLLRRWQLPGELIAAVASHHEPLGGELPPLVVHLADQISRGLGFVPDLAVAPRIAPATWSALSLDDDQIEQVAFQTLVDFEGAREMLRHSDPG